VWRQLSTSILWVRKRKNEQETNKQNAGEQDLNFDFLRRNAPSSLLYIWTDLEHFLAECVAFCPSGNDKCSTNLTLEDGPIGCPATSARTCNSALCKITKGPRYHSVYHCELAWKGGRPLLPLPSALYHWQSFQHSSSSTWCRTIYIFFY
jgi:hypothetical protein